MELVILWLLLTQVSASLSATCILKQGCYAVMCVGRKRPVNRYLILVGVFSDGSCSALIVNLEFTQRPPKCDNNSIN